MLVLLPKRKDSASCGYTQELTVVQVSVCATSAFITTYSIVKHRSGHEIPFLDENWEEPRYVCHPMTPKRYLDTPGFLLMPLGEIPPNLRFPNWQWLFSDDLTGLCAFET